MKRIIFNIDEIFYQMALLENGKLKEYHPEKKEDRSILGNIYKGKVKNVLKGMQSAFIDIGLNKNAFLFSSDLQYNDKNENNNNIITKVIKSGQELMVQVSKEAVGTKNPRVTANISIPGRYMVMMPEIDYLGISHRITDEKEKARLIGIIKKMKNDNVGIIIRTAAEKATEEDLYNDFKNLLRLYEELKIAYKNSSGPSLIYEENNFVIKYLRDIYNDEIEEIVVNNKNEFENIKKYLKSIGKDNTDFVKYENGDLISLYGIDYQIEKLLDKKIWLKSGGFIIIDQTEALTVIDVNTGKYIGNSSLEETIYKTNKEAAEEIALQLRLRDIGGIIIIDFIDMTNENFKKKLLDIFKESLQKDRSKCTVLGFTQLGLVEMTRKRVRSQVSFYLANKCPVCKGEGIVFSDEYLLQKIIREVNRICTNVLTDKIYIKANKRVIKLFNQLEEKIKEDYNVNVEIIQDNNKSYDEFEIGFY